jgi:hypothetical protein
LSEQREPAGLMPAHGETWEDVARYWYTEWCRIVDASTGELLEHTEIRWALSEELRRVQHAIRDLCVQADQQSVTPGMVSTNVLAATLHPERHAIDEEPVDAPT